MTSTTPLNLRNDSAAGQLWLEWETGQAQAVSHARLREACLCAFCRARRLKGETVEAAAGLRLTAVQPQGYGLQLVFSDGHDRGIYPWSLLAQLAEP